MRSKQIIDIVSNAVRRLAAVAETLEPQSDAWLTVVEAAAELDAVVEMLGEET